jgi:hypothetical protein
MCLALEDFRSPRIQSEYWNSSLKLIVQYDKPLPSLITILSYTIFHSSHISSPIMESRHVHLIWCWCHFFSALKHFGCDFWRIILESDANIIASRVAMRGADADVPLSEQTISQALATAKEHLARSLLKWNFEHLKSLSCLRRTCRLVCDNH